jgi:multidrug efflux pump subunit AcrA (membrane-fusion protein)
MYITNTGGLEAVAYVSSGDIRDVAVGAKASISGAVTGTVVRVAGAVDPVTKKAEVRISVPADAPLVSGQSATIEIARAVRKITDTTITIPLSAVKITPEGTIVFTLSSESQLVAHHIVLGSLHGSKVDVASGITLDDVIVKDARGLKVGQKVESK